MTIPDEELDRLFRAAAPARLDTDVRLDAAAIGVRESIIRGTWRRHTRSSGRGLRWAAWATATVAVVAAVVVSATVLLPSHQAVALTPPPLTYGSAEPLSDVLADAHDALLSPPLIEQRPGVESVVWGWSAEMGTGHVEVVPQNVNFVWEPGGDATTTVTAGEPYWSDEDRPGGIEPSPYEPGELIDEVVMPAEQFLVPAAVADLSGSTPAELESALSVFSAGPGASSGELVAAMTGLLDYWTLSDDQHATLLDLLQDAGGVVVRGETVDRLGRDVVGLRVSSIIPERVETVFVSMETGRIVGVESELVEPLDQLPAGVITYTMWDVADRDG